MTEIKIVSVKTYRSSQKLIKMDRIKVVLDMPLSSYSELRKVIEGPHLFSVVDSSKYTTPEAVAAETGCSEVPEEVLNAI